MSPLLAVLALVQAPSVEIPFRTLSFGANGKIKDGGAIVMRDAAAFDAYRKRMGTSGGKKPIIAWGREQVIAIHASGTGYGPSSIHVVKVRKNTDGALEIEAALDQGSRPATPTPGVVRVLRREGLYTLIVVPPATGEVTLKMIAPPANSGDRSGTPG